MGGMESRFYDDEACSKTPKIFLSRNLFCTATHKAWAGTWRSWAFGNFEEGWGNSIHSTRFLQRDQTNGGSWSRRTWEKKQNCWLWRPARLYEYQHSMNPKLGEMRNFNQRFPLPVHAILKANENIILIGLQCKRGIKNCITINWVNGTEKTWNSLN